MFLLFWLCLQPNQEMVTTPDLSSLSSPLIDAERNLGLLLGLHASYLAMSTPLSRIELECASESIYLVYNIVNASVVYPKKKKNPRNI